MANTEQIKTALESIRPSLQNDGGDLELVKIEDNNVYLKLKGACAGCPYSTMTVKNGIEKMLRDNIDKDITVINVQ